VIKKFFGTIYSFPWAVLRTLSKSKAMLKSESSAKTGDHCVHVFMGIIMQRQVITVCMCLWV
jgi:hypothetical protein